MTKVHGLPVWFELATTQGQLGAAGDFYARLLGWQVADAGMEGFAYHLASSDGDMVAGLMEIPDGMAEMPPNWTIYFGVDDADRAAAAIAAAGGRIWKEPADIPGTGRFAVAADPQGAPFGILAPLPMADGSGGGAFDQRRAGHGNWTELMSSDPAAGFAFYADLFGWSKGEAMDMGEMGTYQLFRHDGADIGGMMGLGGAPRPCWLAYFGVNGVNPAIARIREGGGTVQHGPHEVPGGAHIAVATDPQGAWFAVVGPLETAA
ncbi:27 kDa antigen Cfp30B [Paracoccus haematequi]|uniref:27 kDa antigen Cfp30B n=1 Tax=Paracoccus haematequi TaxID=2491866 RepID=A0A3S4CIL7_9RHOB|nr:VOC family protein [Paracoccus haematequi]VDS08542.1 27 kDa antigen Cfp30B [Paracoccus haematequi]